MQIAAMIGVTTRNSTTVGMAASATDGELS